MDPVKKVAYQLWQSAVNKVTSSPFGTTIGKVRNMFSRAFFSQAKRETTPEQKEYMRRLKFDKNWAKKGMSEEEVLAFVRKIDKVNQSANIGDIQASIVEAFRNKRWDDPIFQHDDFLYYACSTYTHGLLTEGEYVAITISNKLSNTDLTRRLSEDQKNTLIQAIRSLPNIDLNIATFVSALNKGDWKAPIFDDENFPHYALLAYMQDLITIEQFGTTQTYWSLLQEKGKDEIEVIRLFNKNGSINEEARKAIRQTLSHVGAKLNDLLHPLMSVEQLENFFEIARKEPYSEQQIFVTPVQQQKASDKSNIRNALNGKVRFNLFSSFVQQPDNKRCQMDAPVGMWNAAMKARFINPVRPQIVIGASPAEDFFPIETRILSIAYPGVPQPTEADGHTASGTDFYYHDWYHIDLVSYIPPDERKRTNDIVDIVYKQIALTEEPLHKDFLNILYNLLLDREFTAYKYGLNTDNKRDIFWHTVTSVVMGTFTAIEEDSFKKFIGEKEKSQQFLTTLFKNIAEMRYNPYFEPQNAQEITKSETFLRETITSNVFNQNNHRGNEIISLVNSIDPARIIYEKYKPYG
ncbi:MAG: hypothetical protein LVR00_00940 [Rhabdochlamydiaceae bacterium]|jgi:hypothetical protein